MKSFKDVLNEKNNLMLIESCLRYTKDMNLDPIQFINFFCDDLQESFNEGLWDNISSRFQQGAESGSERKQSSPYFHRMGNKLGSFIQKNADRIYSGAGKVKNAYDSFSAGVGGSPAVNVRNSNMPVSNQNIDSGNSSIQSALSSLSKRINTSPELQKLISDKNFSQKLIDLMSMLKELKESFDYKYIENNLIYLSNMGINVNELVKFYINETNVMEEGFKDWFAKAGSWLGGQWSNLKGAVRNWNKPSVERSKALDIQSVQNAMKELENFASLGKNVPDEFKNLLHQVYKHLSSVNNELKGTTSSGWLGTDGSAESSPPTTKAVANNQNILSKGFNSKQGTSTFDGSSIVPKTTKGTKILDKQGRMVMPKNFDGVGRPDNSSFPRELPGSGVYGD